MLNDMIKKNKLLYKKKNWMYEIDPEIVISDLETIKNKLEKLYSKYREMGNFDYEWLAPDICDDLRELIGVEND